MFKPAPPSTPRLILIAGCTGTGKSTFGMNIALSEGIMKCISTDTLRQVMRSFTSHDAIHRSSYSGSGHAATQWLETAAVLNPAIVSVVDDSIKRRNSLVLEGVHIVPGNDIIRRWEEAHGFGVGVLLVISDQEAHRKLIYQRGKILKTGAKGQLDAFNRIREIQSTMIERAEKHNWMIIEQQLAPNPMDAISEYFEMRQSTKPRV